ncbi:uncharacterized protein PV09_04925 [Verruconis gallopava]|uniref:N-acetyltransferase domain-containing protein n=1 Tax=Verruconis gallopava TaxID=253628 RepID=A0A0D2AY87_9PEZI|nr:uncharacterized protein PV09_04925 [Verruconis gallopava]KIW04114.1 hypothetical protein PV09_04925 [Verruconis gallopava]
MESANPTTTLPVVESRRLTLDDVQISPVTARDLLSLAEGYYASFPASWHRRMEPPTKSSVPVSVRAARFAKRMEPWLKSPDTKWMKATLRSDPEQRVIGHAGWLMPVDDDGRRFIKHHWTRGAVEQLGWKEMMGWSDAEVEEMWEHVDVERWERSFKGLEEIREKRMRGIRHWFLAPLWTLPEYQGRGVASLLLKETLDLADATDPPTAVYLESMPEARKVYEHFGFKGIPGCDIQMVRTGPQTKP